MHGIQAWVGLPREQEETDPAFDHHGADDLPDLRGGRPLGAADRRRGVRREGQGAHAFADVLRPLETGRGGAARSCGRAIPSAPPTSSPGSVEVDGADVQRRPDARVRAGRAGALHRRRRPPSSCCSGGEPIGERFIEWNFVSSSQERIEQAKADWRAGRMKLPEHDDANSFRCRPIPRRGPYSAGPRRGCATGAARPRAGGARPARDSRTRASRRRMSRCRAAGRRPRRRRAGSNP